MEVVLWFGIPGKYWHNPGRGIVTALHLYWLGMNANRITHSQDCVEFIDGIVVTIGIFYLTNPELVVS